MEGGYELFSNYKLEEHILMVPLLMMRMIPLTFITPFLGGKLVPPETRMGIAIGMTGLFYSVAIGQIARPFEPDFDLFILLMLKELFIGSVIGFVATELFFAMEMGGRAIDVMRGSNMAEVQVPELQIRASPLGQFNFQLLLVVFCAVGGHGLFIDSIADSIKIVPLDQFPLMSAGFDTLINEFLLYTMSVFKVAFGIVFPGLFAAFLVDVVFGMFNRIAPQLNAYFMAMGVKAMAGIALFMFSLTLMFEELGHQLEGSLLFVRRMISLLG